SSRMLSSGIRSCSRMAMASGREYLSAIHGREEKPARIVSQSASGAQLGFDRVGAPAYPADGVRWTYLNPWLTTG
ncbi:MAG: hypothetical protein L0191_14690, partial [Acidobacteria bacterium]|nr:hypothetical protein [Acidobacteriota bacterium]